MMVIKMMMMMRMYGDDYDRDDDDHGDDDDGDDNDSDDNDDDDHRDDNDDVVDNDIKLSEIKPTQCVTKSTLSIFYITIQTTQPDIYIYLYIYIYIYSLYILRHHIDHPAGEALRDITHDYDTSDMKTIASVLHPQIDHAQILFLMRV
jgi:hypothetical protein